MRSMPVTRSGSGVPSMRAAQTTGWPSAVASSQPSTAARSAASRRYLTTFAALIATCWIGARAATAASARSTASASVTTSTGQPATRMRVSALEVDTISDRSPRDAAARPSSG